MTPLTTFLLARITEDEDAAKAVPVTEQWENPAEYGVRFSTHDSDHSYEDTLFLNRNSPTRVLAECEAKRRTVELAVAADEAMDPPTTLILADEVLLALAHVYADHPDFDPAWAVSE